MTARKSSSPSPSPSAALADVRDRIAKSARIAGREPDDIALVAISKTHPAERIVPLLEAGQRLFGENRVQEAQDKWPALRDRYRDVELHMVGQLQSNKADDAVAFFDCIHSLDRPSLLKALAKAMDKQDRRIPCFVQVDIGEEPQKGGCPIADLPDFLARVRDAGIPLAGLMAVPPFETEPAPYFALLAKLARENAVAGQSMGLSMGMSGDFESAVRLGATHVRVGSALFGTRS